ncbi:hypothetical protein ABK040_006069 [Willaertia magna]
MNRLVSSVLKKQSPFARNFNVVTKRFAHAEGEGRKFPGTSYLKDKVQSVKFELLASTSLFLIASYVVLNLDLLNEEPIHKEKKQ